MENHYNLTTADELAPFGRYKDGTPISEHPTETEIIEHMDYYYELMDAEQRLMWIEYQDSFHQLCIRDEIKNKPVEEAIEIAVKRWDYFWPTESRFFFNTYLTLMRNSLLNQKGFSTDKDKSMLLYGAIPQRIRFILEQAFPELWQIGKDGTYPGLKLFYKVIPRAKIGGKGGL